MDIGSLTGQIEIEDQVSSALTKIVGNLKNFALEFDGILGSIASGSVLAAAGIGVITSAVIALGTRGADVNDMSGSLDRFSGSAANSAEILEKMKVGTLGVVTNFDLMKASTKLLAADVKLTADNFGTLGSAATVLANQGLGSTHQMLNMVSQAMLTGRTRSLEMAIGKIDMTKAEEKYAASLGTVRKDLTELEKTEARRVGILDALNARVRAAGVQNRDFGETMQAVVASVKNWFDQLASVVAASPAVQGALAAIGASFNRVFGGTSDAAIKSIANGIDDFARAVAAVVPYIADFLGLVGQTIGVIWDYRKAILAVIAAYVLYEAGTKAAIFWTEAAVAAAIAAEGGLYAVATAAGAATLAVAATVAPIALMAAGLRLTYELYALWSEKSEQAASATQNQAQEAANLATINQRLGTSFKTMGEAQAETYKRGLATTEANKGAAAAAAKTAEEVARVGKLSKDAAEQSKQLSDQLMNGSKELRITEGVLNSYNSAQLQSYTVLERVVPKIMELAAAHRPLNDTLREAHANFVAMTMAQTADGIEKLKAHGITLNMITTNQKLGQTLKDIAFFLSVVNDNGLLASSSGTSFSAPLTASLVTGVWQMLPELTAKELLNTIRSRASQSNSPDNQLGYGIPNFTYIITSTDSEKTTNFVSVFPNPAMNQVKIEFLDNLQSDQMQIDLVDSKGAVSIVRILPINSKEFLIDISNQKPGLYLLRCQRGRQHFIHKILKIE